jgi:diguanylate cyclase (GGDEF)-like protein
MIRTEDLVARVGGDEFAAVLVAISKDQALIIGERIRAWLSKAEESRGGLQISLGAVQATLASEDPEAWLVAALIALRHDKVARGVLRRTPSGRWVSGEQRAVHASQPPSG